MRRAGSVIPFDTPAVRTLIAWLFAVLVALFDAKAAIGVGAERIFLPVSVILAVGWGVSGLTGARTIGLLVLSILQDVLGGGVPGAWLIVTIGTAFFANAALSMIVLAGTFGRLVVAAAAFFAAFVLIWLVGALAGTAPSPGLYVTVSLMIGGVFLIVFRTLFAVEPEDDR